MNCPIILVCIHPGLRPKVFILLIISKAIVPFAFLRVTQYSVSFLKLLEVVGSLLIAGTLVRMLEKGEFPVCLLNFIMGGSFRKPNNVIQDELRLAITYNMIGSVLLGLFIVIRLESVFFLSLRRGHSLFRGLLHLNYVII